MKTSRPIFPEQDQTSAGRLYETLCVKCLELCSHPNLPRSQVKKRRGVSISLNTHFSMPKKISWLWNTPASSTTMQVCRDSKTLSTKVLSLPWVAELPYTASLFCVKESLICQEKEWKNSFRNVEKFEGLKSIWDLTAEGNLTATYSTHSFLEINIGYGIEVSWRLWVMTWK